MCENKAINSIMAFIEATKADYTKWEIACPWFRGEPTSDRPLLPRLYRQKHEGDYYENRLLQTFRMMAPSLGYHATPPRDHTDQWLFLAQHVGLPTRLLDWTEGSLIALYFALHTESPAVWMLNPLRLNWLSVTDKHSRSSFDTYSLTWCNGIKDRHSVNLGSINIRGAWEQDVPGVDLPVAVHPTYIHPRMTVQRSCFTVHGKQKASLNTLVHNKDVLLRYTIDVANAKEMLDELRVLGITRATLFPDLDGLATDITRLFRPDLAK